MSKEKIEKLKKAIASSATPDSMKKQMKIKLAELEESESAPNTPDWLDFQGDVLAELMAIGELTYSDADGVLAAHTDWLEEQHSKGNYDVQAAANTIWEKAKVKGGKLNVSKKDKKLKKSKPISKDEVYIEYLNKDKGHKNDKKSFKTDAHAITWGKSNIENFNIDMIKYYEIGNDKPSKKAKPKARGVKEAMDQAKPKNISGKSKSFEEQFEELKKQDKGKLKLLCEEVMKKSEDRKAKAKESTQSREGKDESTRAVDTGIKTASALTSLAEKADLSDDKQKQFLELMKQLMTVIAGIKKVLGGGALSKEQKEAFKQAVNLED